MHKLYSRLRRRYPKAKKPTYDEPADALVYAIISENMDERAAQTAIKRFAYHFIDLNELRVSRVEEITEVLGEDTLATRDIASALTRALAGVFDRYNTISLKALKKTGKRPARGILEGMDGISTFAVDFCMLTSLQGHAIPLTKKMIEYLKDNRLVHADADEQDIAGFLARQISAENAYEFYALLRGESESARGKKDKRKVKRKK